MTQTKELTIETYSRQALDELKIAYMTWLDIYYAEYDEGHEPTPIDERYGPHEWDDLDQVDDDGTVRCATTQGDGRVREIVMTDDKVFVRVGDLIWVGDDCDYYDSILHFFGHIHRSWRWRD